MSKAPQQGKSDKNAVVRNIMNAFYGDEEEEEEEEEQQEESEHLGGSGKISDRILHEGENEEYEQQEQEEEQQEQEEEQQEQEDEQQDQEHDQQDQEQEQEQEQEEYEEEEGDNNSKGGENEEYNENQSEGNENNNEEHYDNQGEYEEEENHQGGEEEEVEDSNHNKLNSQGSFGMRSSLNQSFDGKEKGDKKKMIYYSGIKGEEQNSDQENHHSKIQRYSDVENENENGNDNEYSKGNDSMNQSPKFLQESTKFPKSTKNSGPNEGTKINSGISSQLESSIRYTSSTKGGGSYQPKPVPNNFKMSSTSSKMSKEEEEENAFLKSQEEKTKNIQNSSVDLSKRASILLKSKKEELKLSKNNEKKNKNIFDQFNEEVLKDKYLINEEIFDELTKNDIVNSKNISSFFQPALYNDAEEYNFHPEINQRSRKIIANKISMLNQMEPENSRPSNSTNRSKSPIELTLYDEAVKRREKMEKVQYYTEQNIKLNASKTKICPKSHKTAIIKVEKNIDEATKTYEKDGMITFFNVAQILTDLHIFRELLVKNRKTKEKVKKSSELKENVSRIENREERKLAELDFLEQLWIILNPKCDELMKSEIFCGFMKILFSPVETSVKEVASILKTFLQAALFLSTTPFKRGSGSEQDSISRGVISPITDRQISVQDIWSLNTLVKHFLILKENLIAYKTTKHFSKEFQKELLNMQKNMTFKPKIPNNKVRMMIFEKKLPTFIEREKYRQQALQEMKKEAERLEFEECTFKPQINSNYNTNNSFAETQQVNVHDKLYKMNKDRLRKLNAQIKEKEKEMQDKEMENCTFKPEIHKVDKEALDRSFNNAEKPRGYNEHVEHTRRGIIERYRVKCMMEKIPVGENYDKIKRMNTQPPNIKDIQLQREKYFAKELAEAGVDVNSESDGEDDYFTMQVKIPSGKTRMIKVYPNDDPREIAESFCKIYGIKQSVQDRLTANIINFKKKYLSEMKDE